MSRLLGKLLTSLVALVTAVGAYLADWNDSHIYNPSWPPHAKFHNAQTMLLATLLGGLALLLVWAPGGGRRRAGAAAVVASLYWISQAGSILFPGTGFTDPGDTGRLPTIGGFTLNQVVLSATMLAILAGGYLLARRE